MQNPSCYNNYSNKYMQSKWIILSILILTSYCASTPPSWGQTDLTQSGQIQLISNQNTTGDAVTSKTFDRAFTSKPRTLLALTNLQVISLPSTNYFLDTKINSSSPTTLDIFFNITGLSTTKHLRICYLSLDDLKLNQIASSSDVNLNGYLDLTPINSGTGQRSVTFFGNLAIYNIKLNLEHVNQLYVWITSFEASVDPQYFNFTVVPKIINETFYSITFGTSHANKILGFKFSSVLFDQTHIESRQVYYFDAGLVQAVNSQYAGLTGNLVWKSNEGFFAGMTSLVAVVNDAVAPPIGFGLSWTTFSVTGMMNFVRMEVAFMNIRMMRCPSGYLYYRAVENLCYTSCPTPDMFWVANNSTCIPCHYRCLTCGTDDPTICLSCNSSRQRYLSGDACLCNPGYYEAGRFDCQPCNPKCQNCTSATVCTSCPANLGRYLLNQSCKCMEHYYEKNNLCYLCSTSIPGCLYCSDQYTCTHCDITLQVQLIQPQQDYGSGDPDDQFPTCSCLPGLFRSPTGCDICANFIPGCETCLSKTICTSCSSNNNFELKVGATVCSCQVGYYLSGEMCVKCEVGCMECVQGGCTVCDTASGFEVDGAGNCVCDAMHLAVGHLCVECSTLIVGCSECSSATLCTKCVNTPHLQQANSVCECASGFSFAPATQTCESCSGACCPIGQYASGGVCVACSGTFPNCLQCSSGTECSACSVSFVLDAGNVCTACAIGCLHCTSSTVCVACDVANHFFLSGQACPCEFGYIFDAAGTACIACPGVIDGCTMCNDTMNCFTCYPGMTFIDNSVVTPPSATLQTFNTSTIVVGVTLGASSYCTCPEGFFINGTSCELCRKAMTGCVSCLTNTSCDNCMPPFELSSGNCTCPSHSFLSGSTCIICNATLPGCTSCSNSTNCTACNTTYGFTLTSSNTCQCSGGMVNLLGWCSPPCPDGQYYDGFQCSACKPICSTCKNQSFTCTSCSASMQLWLATCLCPAGTFLNLTNQCQPCSNSCLTCTITATTCLTCQTSSMVISGSTCICASRYFMDTTCMPCDPTCLSCEGSATNCTSCEYNSALIGEDCVLCDTHCSGCYGPTAAECYSCAWPYQNSSGVCMCGPTRQYINATGACRSCHASCRTCDGSTATDCLSCYSSQKRVLDGQTCICELPFMDARMLTCVNPCPTGFGSNGTNICDEICGDGKVYEKECDDGNTVDGDGCDSVCKIETGFQCVNGTTTTPSICSSGASPSMKLIETVKDPLKNMVKFLITFQPVTSSLTTITNFSQVLTSDLPNTTFTYSYNPNGQLTILAQYSTNLQSLNATFTFNPSVAGGAFFATSPTSITFPLQSSNNLAVDYYEESTYEQSVVFGYACYAVLGLGLAVFAVSLFAGRFIGVEMIGVVQAAFVGLMGLIWLPPLMAKLGQLQFANGLNTYFYDFKDGLVSSGDLVKGLVPPSISSLHYQSEMFYSMNYSVILLLLPPIAALIFFIASKIIKRKQITQKLRRWSWVALCDFGMTATVFVLYHVIVSMAVFAQYTTTKSNLFALSIVDCILVIILSVPCLVLFKTHPQHFGAYKVAFKPDTLSQFHYWLLVSTRILLAVLLVAVNTMQYVCFICMAIPVTCLIYLAIRRPYLHLYNNIRAILNELFLACILAIYGYFRTSTSTPQSTLNTALPILVIILLIITIILNLLAMLKYKCDQKNLKQAYKSQVLSQAVDKIVDTENKEFMRETTGRWNAGRPNLNLREMGKGSMFKEESIDQRLLETGRVEAGRLLMMTPKAQKITTMTTTMKTVVNIIEEDAI